MGLSLDRADIVHAAFLKRVAAGDLPAGAAPVGPMAADQALAAFLAGCYSRTLERAARVMNRAGQGLFHHRIVWA